MDLSTCPAAPRVTELSWPTRIVLGPGALARLPRRWRGSAMRRPLVVTDAGVVKAGLARACPRRARARRARFGRFDGVQPNPTERDASRARGLPRGGCDGIVAIGGGSSLDAAKLVQLLTTHEPPLSRYDDATGGDRFVKDDMPPLIAIPTTAGTGSEVGRSGVATLPDTGRKTVIFSPYLLPKAAICDPELTVGLPPASPRPPGMDAFTHCLEAYLASGFHPLADAVALDGIRRVARSLPVAVRDGKDLAARTDMMIAAMEGAMAFQKGLGACHALAHALTPISGRPPRARERRGPARGDGVQPRGGDRAARPRRVALGEPGAAARRRSRRRQRAGARARGDARRSRRGCATWACARRTCRASPPRRSRTPRTGRTRARAARRTCSPLRGISSLRGRPRPSARRGASEMPLCRAR